MIGADGAVSHFAKCDMVPLSALGERTEFVSGPGRRGTCPEICLAASLCVLFPSCCRREFVGRLRFRLRTRPAVPSSGPGFAPSGSTPGGKQCPVVHDSPSVQPDNNSEKPFSTKGFGQFRIGQQHLSNFFENFSCIPNLLWPLSPRSTTGGASKTAERTVRTMDFGQRRPVRTAGQFLLAL
jgi:hypothetical protein